MSQINQKTAVVEAIKDTLGTNYDPNRSVNDQLTSGQRKLIVDRITAGIINGDILYNKDVSDESAVRRYASGMISNHIRKVKELNGGGQYSPTSTGRGTRDAKLSTLKKLLQNYDENSSEHAEIQGAITARQSELQTKTVKTVSEKRTMIDISDLPDDLRDLAIGL